MAEEKKPTPPEKKPAPEAKKEAPKAAPVKTADAPKAPPAKAPAKASEATKTPPAKAPAKEKPTPAATKTKPAPAKTKAGASKPAAKKEDEVKIVDKPTPRYVALAKPTLTPEQKQGLALRRQIDARRPRFRRQQWYEYKRLADSGWRKPTGIDSAMRRHFGYEQSVVRIGFGGPKAVRGLHPSGFQEVYVATLADLKTINAKTQAARFSGNLGARKLKVLYAEADKLGVRILNRRNLQ